MSWTPADVFGTIASVGILALLFYIIGSLVLADGHVEFCQIEVVDLIHHGDPVKYKIVGVRSWRPDVSIYYTNDFDDACEKAELICKLWKK